MRSWSLPPRAASPKKKTVFQLGSPKELLCQTHTLHLEKEHGVNVANDRLLHEAAFLDDE